MPPIVLDVDLDTRSAVTVGLAVLGLLAVFALAAALRQTLTWIGIGTLFALALDPLVNRISARLGVRRQLAVAIVLGGLVTLVSVLVVITGPAAIRQARDFREDLPQVLGELTALPIVGQRLEDNHVPDRIQNWIDELPSRLGSDATPIESVTRSVMGGVLAAFCTVLVTVVLLLDGDRLLRDVGRAVPVRQRPRVERLAGVLYRTVGRYFAGSLFVSSLTGAFILVAGLALRIPLAPIAAIWAMSTNLIPQIGGFLGGSFFVLLGLSKSPTTGLLCLVAFLIWQQTENHVLGPTIVGEAVDLSPPATMLAALIGVSAAGVPGALVAVPLLGTAKALWRETHPLQQHASSREAPRNPLSRWLHRRLRYNSPTHDGETGQP